MTKYRHVLILFVLNLIDSFLSHIEKPEGK